jgi:phage gp36-like protein
MTTLLDQAFKEARKLPKELQDEVAQQLLEDIKNELQWLVTLSSSDINISVLEEMARIALMEDEEGKTEEKGFGEDQKHLLKEY